MDRETFKESIVNDLLSYKNYWHGYSDNTESLRVINSFSPGSDDGFYEYIRCVTDEVAAKKGRAIEKVLTFAGEESLYPLAIIKVDSVTKKVEVMGN